MIRFARQRRELSLSLIALPYALAVCTLTWLTIENHLGDQMYGAIVMTLIALPVSIIQIPINYWLREAVNVTYGWEYPVLAWPGVVTAIILAILLLRQHTTGRILGWFLAGCIILTGLAITFDQWAPRHPYGWPFLVYGLVMIIGLLGSGTKTRDAIPGRDVT
ncbi:hypothetical protein AB0B89_17335 [Sphaerisporangium sp. NPDC049002]|uniref:hypothetical protein n=1 Tax=Sphaerisporangium sp. NPDC049002 TaxID=3155392 RepID=UPI0033C07EDB